ncbi:GntR family transcriptional regulator [Streptomyces sp. 7R007]
MSEVPLKHQRITQVLAKEIRTGRRAAGERLPGEHALAQRFGVSRTTVRAALAELNAAGLITTRTGKGSYVRFDARPPQDRLGWARPHATHDLGTRLRTLAVHRVRDAELAGRLALDSPEFVCVERVRELAADDTVVSYERTCLPPVPGLDALPAQGLAPESLTDVMLRAGLCPDHGEQCLGGRPIDAREAGVLRRAPGEWFLHTRRTSRAADDTFVEHTESLLDPGHFHLTLRFS